MTTYTFTISATFEADDHDEAWDEWTAWLTEPSNLENGTAILNGPDAESDAIWQSLTPAAKASWVRAMQPEPPVEGTCSTCGAAYGEMGHDPEPCEGYDPTDPGFTPEAERCPAGGAHVWTDNLTPAQILTGLRPRSGVLVWCENCSEFAAIDPEDR